MRDLEQIKKENEQLILLLDFIAMSGNKEALVMKNSFELLEILIDSISNLKTDEERIKLAELIKQFQCIIKDFFKELKED